MHIGVIGAGFTGLTAAWRAVQAGHTVTILEKEAVPGGLAMGFRCDTWEWALEKHYHHIFRSDESIRRLAAEIGVPFTFSRPNTSSMVDDAIFPLDSPSKLLAFSKLSLGERIRMGAVLGYLKYIADWRSLEGATAHGWLTKHMGAHAYGMLWEPLLRGKFGSRYQDISLAWFWARIKARTTELGYPEGGFQRFADVLAQKILDEGGTIRYGVAASEIEQTGRGVRIVCAEDDTLRVDRLLVTLPNVAFADMTPQLPSIYTEKLRSFEGIGACNLVLELSQPFFTSDVYWLSVCQDEIPFLAIVEHTHFVDPKHYGGSHLVYVGNYLPTDHEYFKLSDEELLARYHPYLARLSPQYRQTVKSITVFRVPFAQPVVTPHFSKKILPYHTPLDGVFLANMQQVYPWDRGTNFAVAAGEEVAELLLDEDSL